MEKSYLYKKVCKNVSAYFTVTYSHEISKNTYHEFYYEDFDERYFWLSHCTKNEVFH